jgi:membrane associated rhomboid family serine protease
MSGLWRKFILSLTPGARLAVSLWAGVFLLSFLLASFARADLGAWLGLTGPSLHHGQFWRLVSYALLPASLMDLIFTSVTVLWFGGMLERYWLPRDFFFYCAIATVGSGLAKILLEPLSSTPLLGPGPIAFAVMVATARICANEPMNFIPNLPLSMRQGVILLAALTAVMMITAVGWRGAVVRCAGGGLGLVYLWCRSHAGEPRSARPAVSQRIHRLEL